MRVPRRLGVTVASCAEYRSVCLSVCLSVLRLRCGGVVVHGWIVEEEVVARVVEGACRREGFIGFAG